MFSQKQVGILYNRCENTLRIVGRKLIKEEPLPNADQLFEILQRQMPFGLIPLKPCETYTMYWDNMLILHILFYFEDDFTLKGTLWISPIHDYRIISNISVEHLTKEELEEYINKDNAEQNNH